MKWHLVCEQPLRAWVISMTIKSIAELRRLDEAARAGWLYYVAGNTQDEIARKLGVSRQSAQRMVSLAMSEGLIKVRLDHPISNCMELSHRLQDRFDLMSCEVVPSDPDDPASLAGLGQAGATEIERYLRTDDSQVIALGTGRTLVACIEELSLMECPQHQIVSLVGNILLDGSASAYDVVFRMANRINGSHYPMAGPVLSRNPSDRQALHKQEHVKSVLELTSQADVTFVGIGDVGVHSPLYVDGFITQEELTVLEKSGAVGEIVSWVYDSDGSLVNGCINDRVASAPLLVDSDKPVYGVAAGDSKVLAIIGALRGKLINSFITNERTAEMILARDSYHRGRLD